MVGKSGNENTPIIRRKFTKAPLRDAGAFRIPTWVRQDQIERNFGNVRNDIKTDRWQLWKQTVSSNARDQGLRVPRREAYQNVLRTDEGRRVTQISGFYGTVMLLFIEQLLNGTKLVVPVLGLLVGGKGVLMCLLLALLLQDGIDPLADLLPPLTS
mgnify:CR=1 FL=1